MVNALASLRYSAAGKIAAEDETATRPQLAGVLPRMFWSVCHETMEQDLEADL
jgi:hypothetical protein